MLWPMKLKRITEGLDISAAIWAGLLAGILFLVALLLSSNSQIGESDLVWRMIAAIVQGEEALDPMVAMDNGLLAAALLVHGALSILFGVLIALVIHRWGLLVGFLGGGLLGFFLYGINFFSMSFFFPWFYPLRSASWLIGHLIFGAAAGSIYELLEINDEEKSKLAGAA